jgi:hypothetical protein
MSHSQFHSTNLFILGHAWLNLWDKHMTTGRINQVTTFPLRRLQTEAHHNSPYSAPSKKPFLTGSSLTSYHFDCNLAKPSTPTERTSNMRPATKLPKFLDLTSFKHTSLCLGNRQEFVAFGEDYQWPARSIKTRAVMADPPVINRSRLTISK